MWQIYVGKSMIFRWGTLDIQQTLEWKKVAAIGLRVLFMKNKSKLNVGQLFC